MEIWWRARSSTAGSRVGSFHAQLSSLIKMIGGCGSPVRCHEEKYKPCINPLAVSLTGATTFTPNWKRPTDCNLKNWMIDWSSREARDIPSSSGARRRRWIRGEDLCAEQSPFGYSARWTSTSSLANWILTRRQGFLNCAWQRVWMESGKFY